MRKLLKEKKLEILSCILILPGYLFLVLLLSSLFFYFIHYQGVNFNLILKQILINKNNVYLYLGLAFSLLYFLVISYLIFFKKSNKYYVSESKEKTYGSSSLANIKEINKNYQLINLEQPKNNYGIVVKSQIDKKNNLLVNIRNNTHSMVIAGTRSGKTQGVVIPTLQVFANSEIKPNILVTDPKGELFESNSRLFKDKGYDVIRLDLRETELSTFWNPLAIIFENWKNGCKLEKEYNKNQKPEFAKHYQYKQKAYDYLSDLCQSLFPINDPKDKFWQESAMGVVKGILLAILYDMQKKQKFALDKFNLAEIVPIINEQDELVNYFKKLDKTHPARVAAATLLNGAQSTTASIIQSVKTGLEKFSDPILRTLISKNKINFSNIINKPTIIFLIIPDDRTDRNWLATLFINQLYKSLIEQANNEYKKLEKPFYFVLDEFANIPQITDMGNKISVSGGRNIWWLLIIQDKAQLSEKYGHNIAKSILNNCSLHIFLQTMDLETAKYYSDMIGEKTIVSKSYSASDKNKSASSSIKGVKLITPGDLQHLPQWEGVVLYSKEKPFKTSFVPIFKWNKYCPNKIETEDGIPITDEEFKNNYFYDLQENYLENKEKQIENMLGNEDINNLKAEKEELEAEILELENNNLNIKNIELKVKKLNEINDIMRSII